jgi:hypothetical protein
MKKWICGLLFLSIIACKSKVNEFTETENSTKEEKPICEIVFQAENGGLNEKTTQLITNNEDFIKFINTVKIDDSEIENILEVDFDVSDIVVYNYGKLSSKSIRSTKIEYKLNAKTQIKLLPTILTLSNLSQNTPFFVVKVPKDTEVEFN